MAGATTVEHDLEGEEVDQPRCVRKSLSAQRLLVYLEEEPGQPQRSPAEWELTNSACSKTQLIWRTEFWGWG